MQWPPQPGPGLNRMKPNGFVEAASSTFQMSMPIRSKTILSSLTRAMLTARKMFSTSLAASASRALPTRTVRTTTLSYRLWARSPAVSSTPPTIFGIVAVLNFLLPGSSRSGEKAR